MAESVTKSNGGSPMSTNKRPSKDGKQFAHYRLTPETIRDVDNIAHMWRTSPSKVLEHLVDGLMQFGADRCRPAGANVAQEVTLEYAIGANIDRKGPGLK